MEIEDDLISLKLPDATQEESIIKVIGVGGGGSNAVNHMFRQGIHGVEFVVCNTDIQALRQSRVKNRIQLGKELTEGRGAGCQPERGRLSAIESIDVYKRQPLHQHFQKKGIPEPKIVTRFWIIGIILAVVTIVTLKIR